MKVTVFARSTLFSAFPATSIPASIYQQTMKNKSVQLSESNTIEVSSIDSLSFCVTAVTVSARTVITREGGSRLVLPFNPTPQTLMVPLRQSKNSTTKLGFGDKMKFWTAAALKNRNVKISWYIIWIKLLLYGCILCQNTFLPESPTTILGTSKDSLTLTACKGEDALLFRSVTSAGLKKYNKFWRRIQHPDGDLTHKNYLLNSPYFKKRKLCVQFSFRGYV